MVARRYEHPPPLPPSFHPEVEVDIGLPAGKIGRRSRTFFLCELQDLSHCISVQAIVYFL